MHVSNVKKKHFINTGDDADLVHIDTSGSTEVIQQFSHTGEWTNQDLQAGTRLYARVKDSNEEFLKIRQGLSESCYIDLQDGMNTFTIIGV